MRHIDNFYAGEPAKGGAVFSAYGRLTYRFRNPHVFPLKDFECKHAFSRAISQLKYPESAIFAFKNPICLLSLAC